MDPQRLLRIFAVAALALAALGTTLYAGLGFGQQRAVGGVLIDASGVVRTATVDERAELANLVRQNLAPVAGDLANSTEMRMISLKGLQQAIADSQQRGVAIPDEVEFLAGLQRIEYVFVDDAMNDFVFAGPAEPWKLREDGFVVGEISGGSTMRLVDLMIALQSVESARQVGISCSIEPTAEGRQRLQQLLKRIQLRPGQNPAVFEASLREAFGPQMIQLTGIPADSRYARTLVAADFEMKRVAMGLTESPVATLPSYLEMSRNSRHAAGQNPRWWMACDYNALTKSEDGLAWKLSGRGVRTMTEQDIVGADGSVEGAGTTDKLAQLWADKMTEHYSELAQQMPVFSDLQKLMDMTLVATLIAQERLDERAGLDLNVLRNNSSGVQLTSYTVPKAVDPQCSFIRGRAGWVVTASGGVDINAFQVVERQVTDNAISKTRGDVLAAATSSRWFWDNH